MTASQLILLMIPVAYLLGSVPFGLLVGWTRGIDVRKAGSGNIGATNVGRLLGKRFFFLVFILDMLKSLVPMLIVGHLEYKISTTIDPLLYFEWLLVGFAAMFGHMFSVFLKFKGGKGVATSAGIILGLWPYYTEPAIITLLIFTIVLYTTRYMSIASMSAAISFPICYLIMATARHWAPFGHQWPLTVFSILLATLVVYKHRTNIQRLRAGTENRLGTKKAEPSV